MKTHKSNLIATFLVDCYDYDNDLQFNSDCEAESELEACDDGQTIDVVEEYNKYIRD